MRSTCPSCRTGGGALAGRCPSCGTVRDVMAVRRQERREATIAVLGNRWYEWIGEAIAVGVVAAVAAGALPVWAVAVAALLLLRPLSRLLALLARAAFDA